MKKPNIHPFVQLGQLLRQIASSEQWPGFQCGLTESEYQQAIEQLKTAYHHNGWFTYEACRQALSEWGKSLDSDAITSWLSPYDLSNTPKKIGIICAGNIPAVGFHDILSVLLSGHHALIKLSKDDKIIIPMLLQWLCRFDEQWSSAFTFVERLVEFDAVIATGSNNSSRYFEYYFGKVPHIIRKSRTSVAVLDGSETPEQLHDLGLDIFTYFGLGCRNVSKIYLPEGMDIDRVFNALYSFREIGNHAKYANNYDYNKAVWLLNREELLDNGFILFKQDQRLNCPTAALFYEYYSNLDQVEQVLLEQQDSIQCRVGVNGLPFGSAQAPQLSDYADGIDTLSFLAAL